MSFKSPMNTPLLETVGSIGIDRIELTNVFGEDAPAPEELKSELETKLKGSPLEQKSIFKKACFEFNEADFCFSFGKMSNGHPYYKLRISSSKKGDQNIMNVDLNYIYTRIKEIQAYLLKNNIIKRPFLIDQIRVYEVELNRTVPLLKSYSDYGRILNLFANNVYKKEDAPDDAVILYAKNFKSNAIETVDVHRKKNRTKKVKCYDKSMELSDKFSFNTDCSFLRCEITLNHQALSVVDIVNDKTERDARICRLESLSMEKLEKYYLDSIHEIFENIENRFRSFSSDLSAALNFSRKVFDNIVYRTVLTKAKETLCESLLNEFIANDRFLDYSDIYASIRSLGLAPSLQDSFIECFQRLQQDRFKDGLPCALDNQRELYEELKEKLTGKNKYRIALYQNFILWAGNPDHVQVGLASGDHFSLSSSIDVHVAHPVDLPQHTYAYYYDQDGSMKLLFMDINSALSYLNHQVTA